MPTLDWLNRTAAFTTAARVPYRLLEQVSIHTATAAPPSPLWGEGGGEGRHDNLLIQGDNLEALKALLPFYRGQVSHLMNERGLPLVTLAKVRFKLAQDIEARVGDLKDKAAKTQFRQLVLEQAWDIEPDWTRPLTFEANRYPVPVGSRYGGRYQFNKHFYPVLADLKDGGEEFFCAQLLDNHAKVKHWVRNLTTTPCGFALATSRGRFFPDFVSELVDGRVAVVEYKGAHLLNDPYEIEKRQIGELWALKSQGRCLFGQVAMQRDGVGMSGQLDALLA